MPPKNYPAQIALPQNEFLHVIYEPPSQLNGHTRRQSCLILLRDFSHANSQQQSDLMPLISTIIGKAGFASLQFDCRGCGDSSGDSDQFSIANGLSDLRKMMDWLREEYKFSQYVIVTEGLSANIALQAFMPNLVTGMVLLWPNFTPMGSHLSFLKDKNNDTSVQKDGFLAHEGTKYGLTLINELNNLNVKPLLETVTCPVLAQHGRADQHVPANNIDILRDYMISARLELGLFEQGEHRLPAANMRKTLMLNIENFLKKIA